MRLRTLMMLIVLGAIAAFAAVNWTAFTTPTTLSLVFAVVQAPLGLIMLAIAALITVLFLVFVVYLQTSVILETRRYGRELQSQRELADKAEASRFTELRGFLDAELSTLAARVAEIKSGTDTRLDQLERDLRASVEQTGNTLAAYIGELEDRVERGISGTNSKPSI
jgi:type III secretory pathway component EscR